MMDSPCKHCPNRHIGCHSVCVDYNSYNAILKEEKEIIINNRKRENIYWDYRLNRSTLEYTI